MVSETESETSDSESVIHDTEWSNLVIIETLEDENHMPESVNQSWESENESSEDEIPPTDPNPNPSTSEKFKWVENGVFVPPVESFVDPALRLCPEMVQILENSPTPLKILQYFIDPDLMNEIVAESDRYKNSKPQLQHLLTGSAAEFWNMFALTTLMGIVKKPSYKDYWTTNCLMETPIFGKIMSRKRYNIEKKNLAETQNFKDLNESFYAGT